MLSPLGRQTVKQSNFMLADDVACELISIISLALPLNLLFMRSENRKWGEFCLPNLKMWVDPQGLHSLNFGKVPKYLIGSKFRFNAI